MAWWKCICNTSASAEISCSVLLARNVVTVVISLVLSSRSFLTSLRNFSKSSCTSALRVLFLAVLNKRCLGHDELFGNSILNPVFFPCNFYMNPSVRYHFTCASSSDSPEKSSRIRGGIQRPMMLWMLDQRMDCGSLFWQRWPSPSGFFITILKLPKELYNSFMNVIGYHLPRSDPWIDVYYPKQWREHHHGQYHSLVYDLASFSLKYD